MADCLCTILLHFHVLALPMPRGFPDEAIKLKIAEDKQKSHCFITLSTTANKTPWCLAASLRIAIYTKPGLWPIC